MLRTCHAGRRSCKSGPFKGSVWWNQKEDLRWWRLVTGLMNLYNSTLSRFAILLFKIFKLFSIILWTWSIRVPKSSKVLGRKYNPPMEPLSSNRRFHFPQAVGVGGSTTATGPLWLGTWATTCGLAEVSYGHHDHRHGHLDDECMILYACIYNIYIYLVYT